MMRSIWTFVLYVVLMVFPLVDSVDIKIGYIQPDYAIKRKEWAVAWGIQVAQHQGIINGHNVT